MWRRLSYLFSSWVQVLGAGRGDANSVGGANTQCHKKGILAIEARQTGLIECILVMVSFPHFTHLPTHSLKKEPGNFGSFDPKPVN